MQYTYKAKDRQGITIDGTIEGETELLIRQRLRGQGLFPIVVSPIGRGAPRTASSRSSNQNTASLQPAMVAQLQSLSKRKAFSKRVQQSDLIVVFSQLSIMCMSGDDLAEAVKNVALQCNHPTLKKTLQSIYDDVAQGAKFSVALSKHPSVFSESVTAAIAAGEHAGKVIEVLDRLTRMMRKDQQLNSSILGMLMYPMALCSITSVVIAAMLFFVLPQFATVFRETERAIPPLTQFLLTIGTTLRSNAIAIGVFVGAMVIAGLSFRSHWRVTRFVDYWVLHCPGLRKPARCLITGRVFRLLGTMLENDLPLLDSIRLVRRSTRNSYFRSMFEQVENEILRGEGMSHILMSSSFLPTGAAHMVSTGERTGKLSVVLMSIGEYFEDEGERSLRSATKLLEPAIIVCLGIVVATVVLSIVLPLLDVTTVS